MCCRRVNRVSKNLAQWQKSRVQLPPSNSYDSFKSALSKDKSKPPGLQTYIDASETDVIE